MLEDSPGPLAGSTIHEVQLPFPGRLLHGMGFGGFEATMRDQ